MTLWLASASPRRADLLTSVGVPFALLSAPDIDETPTTGETPGDYVLRMAIGKAAVGCAAPRVHADDWVLAADTTVAVDGRILGKPADSDQAAEMLRLLSGREHRVLSAVTLSSSGRQWQAMSDTQVRFAELEDTLIARYIASGEPFGKAGGYAIQGFGAALVTDLHGSYSGVVGLPLQQTVQLLQCVGVPFWQSASGS